MKTLVSCCLVLFVFFVFCGDVVSSSREDRLSKLEAKMAYLEGLFMQSMNEIQAVKQDAKPVYAEAEAIIKGHKPGTKFTWKEKSKINLAAYYEQYIARLDTLLRLIILEMFVVDKEIKALKGQKEAKYEKGKMLL